MFNATPQHSYSRVPVEPPDEHKKRASGEPSLWSLVTFGWVAGRLSTAGQQSHDGLVSGQRSAWWNFRSLRHAWNKHARSAQTREENPRLWRAVFSFALSKNLAQLFLLPTFILCARVLQAVMFAAILSFHPYWLAVTLEGLVRSHYAFFAHLTSASVISGLTGLVHDKVIHIMKT